MSGNPEYLNFFIIEQNCVEYLDLLYQDSWHVIWACMLVDGITHWIEDQGRGTW